MKKIFILNFIVVSLNLLSVISCSSGSSLESNDSDSIASKLENDQDNQVSSISTKEELLESPQDVLFVFDGPVNGLNSSDYKEGNIEEVYIPRFRDPSEKPYTAIAYETELDGNQAGIGFNLSWSYDDSSDLNGFHLKNIKLLLPHAVAIEAEQSENHILKSDQIFLLRLADIKGLMDQNGNYVMKSCTEAVSDSDKTDPVMFVDYSGNENISIALNAVLTEDKDIIALSNPNLVKYEGSYCYFVKVEDQETSYLTEEEYELELERLGGNNSSNSAGALLKAIHHNELKYESEGDAGSVFIPLPISYATQVPLSLSVSVEPEEIVEKIAYEKDKYGNFGMTVHFKSEGSAEQVVMHWESIALTRNIDDEERSLIYAEKEDPSLWLKSTKIVDSQYQGIADTVDKIITGSDSPVDKMADILQWTAIDAGIGGGEITGLDSTSVYESRVASCTGFANLAAALGRKADIPTVNLANYMVGMSQQTHYINEFYLGEDKGWRRVEPQLTKLTVPESYAFVVRRILPEEENDDVAWAIKGVPVKSLVTPLTGLYRMAPIYQTNYFDDCSVCDNRAELLIKLGDKESDGTKLKELFEKAKNLWEKDMEYFLNGDPAEVMEKRASAENISSIEELETFLNSIER